MHPTLNPCSLCRFVLCQASSSLEKKFTNLEIYLHANIGSLATVKSCVVIDPIPICPCVIAMDLLSNLALVQ